jgi:hypothetical protein
MASLRRPDSQMTVVVAKCGLHEEPSALDYWLSREPVERLAALEVIRQRVFGGRDETRQGLQRVCRVVGR